jgi:hypothetical protein
MESEMAAVEHDFKGVEESYGTDVLAFAVIRSYVRKLIENRTINNYLEKHHRDILGEIRVIAAIEQL